MEYLLERAYVAIYVLIHGGNHGAWCWDKVASLLRKEGHLVEAPDLPGHGKDKTPIQDVTLQSCIDEVCSVINAQSEPVILVGHSMGGLVISQVAEQVPDKIRVLVYLSALLLRSGESWRSGIEACYPFLNMSADQNHFTVKSEVADLPFNVCCLAIISLSH
jgi:pimeloyl-ACP methyl ester carboxylesterase